MVVSAEHSAAHHSCISPVLCSLGHPCMTACPGPISSVNDWVSAANEDYFSKVQWHFQEFDWNPNRGAPFSFLLPNFDGSIVGTVLLVKLYNINAEIWFISPFYRTHASKKKQEKNPCLDRCWISYLPVFVYRGILMDRSGNLFPKAKAWFLRLIQI